MSVEPKEQRRIELAAFWIGLGIVLALLIGLVWSDRPFAADRPLLAATVTGVEENGERLIAHYEVRNQGERAATEVLVRITIPGWGEVDQTIAHLPTGTVRAGVAILYGAPRGQRPVARILGYQQP